MRSNFHPNSLKKVNAASKCLAFDRFQNNKYISQAHVYKFMLMSPKSFTGYDRCPSVHLAHIYLKIFHHLILIYINIHSESRVKLESKLNGIKFIFDTRISAYSKFVLSISYLIRFSFSLKMSPFESFMSKTFNFSEFVCACAPQRMLQIAISCKKNDFKSFYEFCRN